VYDTRLQYILYRLPLFELICLIQEQNILYASAELLLIFYSCCVIYLILNLKFIFYLLQSHYLKSVSGSALALLLANNQDVAVAVKVMENLNTDIFEDFFIKVC
jgi:hypothetical protein